MSILALLPGLILAAAASGPAATPEAVRREVVAVYADGDFQALPPLPEEEEPAPETGSVAPPRRTPRGSPSPSGPSGKRDRVDLPGSSGDLSGLVRFLAWSILGTVALLAVVWLAREWVPFWPGGPMRRRRREAASPGTATVEIAPVVEDRRPEYEVHADEGRFPEAIHALLLATLWEIGRRRRHPFGSALTSREILPRTGLEAAALDALGGIVRTVEGSRFGGAEVGRENYEDCVDRHGRVLGALARVRT